MQFLHAVYCFFSTLFTINVGIGTYFVYFHCYLEKDVIPVKFGTRTQTTI